MPRCALHRAFGVSAALLLGLAFLSLAGACSSSSAPEETVMPFGAADPTGAPSAASSPEEAAVPFLVCGFSLTWTRPSEEEQAKEIWYGPRYSGAPNRDLAEFRSIFYEDFFAWHGGNSELGDHWRLHGLWSAAHDWSPVDPACADGRRVGRDVISVFLLLHEAKAVTLSGNTYRITVEATRTGFEEIQFANLVSPIAPKPEYPTTASFRAWFRRWARGTALLPESLAEEQPVPKQQPTDYNLLIIDTSGRELARAEGGIRFERLVDATPTATQAGVGP
jgi:hypothetical protein